MQTKRYYVYILSSYKRTLYVGMTNDLARRLYEHRENKNNAFTARYNISMLVHDEVIENVNEAIAREKEIKGWRHSKKVALIQEHNLGWNDLIQSLN